MPAEAAVHIVFFVTIAGSLILICMATFICLWMFVSSKCQSLKTKRTIVIEDLNGQIGWMGSVIGPDDVEHVRLTSLRHVLSSGAWRDLRALVIVSQLSRFSDASFV